MSAKRDNSTPVSLFPFLAVLLCTMGALVVLLVAMAHVSRQQAIAGVETNRDRQATAAVDPDQVLRKSHLEIVTQRQKELEEQRTIASKALREEQLRLASIEESIRDLEDHVKSLRFAIQDVIEEDSQHYDDHAQAEKNLAHLEKLIAETSEEIEQLKKEQGTRKSYSFVPYSGKNGTRRLPLYIECTEFAAILQPEGVRLFQVDLATKLTSDTSLARIIRATKQFYHRDHPEWRDDPDKEPYPLIIVRPGGIKAYQAVRDALEEMGSDYGYEMVEADWELKYPPANEALAVLQERERKNARLDLLRLARSAPSKAAESGISPQGIENLIRNQDAAQMGTGTGAQQHSLSRNKPKTDSLQTGKASSLWSLDSRALSGSSQNGTPSEAVLDRELGVHDGSGGIVHHMGRNLQAEDNSLEGIPGLAGISRSGSRSQASSQQMANAGNPQNGGSGSNSSQPGGGAGGNSSAKQQMMSSTSSSDWALIHKRKPTDIPIRRKIQIIVRNDSIVFLPSRDLMPSSDGTTPIGRTLSFEGPTQKHLNDFVVRIRQEVQAWGIAGEGLYWRPAIEMNVAADGYRRADDLTRLMSGSGVDIRTARTALQTVTGGAHATH